ncbi:MAG: tandem-95 repeat protein, partial [Alteraurantiacibacter sp.]
LFGLDSGEDTITELGSASDIDRVVFDAEIATKDVSLIRLGDDLFIELERDDGFLIDTITVTNHFLGAARGVEEIVFGDGTVWDADFIAANLRPGRFNAQNDIVRFGVEDEPITIDPAVLMENDAADLTGITFVGVGSPRDGTVYVDDDGMIVFQGAKDHNGDAFFNYTVEDEFGRQSTARVEVNLSPRNDAPVAVDDPLQYGIEDIPLRIRVENLLANDWDVDGDAEQEGLRIVAIRPLTNLDGDAINPYKHRDYDFTSTHVSAKLDGQYIEFKPRPDYFGFAGFRYVLQDNSGATSTADVEIYFAPVNDAPRIRNHEKRVRIEQTTELSIDDLMRHVYDIEGDAVSFVGLIGGADENPASNGSLVFDAATGLIDYTPARLGWGTIQFEVIDERGLSAVLDYKINVRPLNDPPKAKDDYGYRTLEDTILLIDPADLLANDTDPNGDTLVFEGVYRFAENGKIRVNEDGMIEFAPRDSFNGSASFEYTISDAFGVTDTATVHITIMPRNEGPILRDDVAAGIEDLTLYIIPGETFGNDLDRDGDVIFYSYTQMMGQLDTKYLSPDYEVEALADNNTALPGWLTFDASTMTFVGDVPEGAIGWAHVAVFLRDPSNGGTYPHRFSFNLEDSQTVLRLESGLSVEADVLEGFTIREPFAKSFEFSAETLGEGVTVEATLADGTPLPEWLIFDPIALTFQGIAPLDVTEAFDARIVFTVDGPNGPATLVETIGIDPAAALAGIAYDSDIALFSTGEGSWSVSRASSRPLPDWLEFDYETFGFQLSGFEPDPDAPVARVQVVWTPDIEQKLSGDTWLSTDRGFTLEFVIDPKVGIDPAINELLQNIPFFAEQGLFAVDLGEAASISSTRESGAPLNSWLDFDAETFGYSGLPVSEYVGAVPIRMDVGGDGAGLPTMSIITEVVVDRTFTVDGAGGMSVRNDGSRINLTLPEDFNGPLVLRYGAEDEKGGKSDEPAFVVFNVRPAAERPDPRGESFEMFEKGEVTFTVRDLLANDRDDDGDPLRLISIGNPANGAITVTLAEVVMDASALLEQLPGGTLTATLANGDALPEWMVLDADTGILTATVPLDVLATLDVVFTATDGTDTASTTLTALFDGNDASITYNPASEFSGTDSLRYTITDDSEGNGSATVTFNVAPLFDPPIAVRDTVNGLEDTVLVIDPATLLANDFDYDGDAITFFGVRNATRGEVSFDGVNIYFTPTPDTDGKATFEYLITDNTHGSSVGLVTVNVKSTNQAPVATLDHFDTVEDTPFEFTIADLLANDFDPDGDAFHFVSLSRNGVESRIQELPGGRWQFVPEENVYGLQTFRYTISDGRKSKSGVIEFDIAAVNDAPIANTDGIFYADQDIELVIDFATLIANDRDVEGDAFSLVEVFDGDNGSVTRNGDTAVFIGREGYFGDAGFHYRVTDEHGATNVGYVEIIVMPEFDVPIAVSDAGFEVLEDGYIDIDPEYLMSNDYVPDEQIPTFLGLVGPGVTLLDNGLYRVTPNADFFGTLTLTYAITNESGFAVPATVTVKVLPVEDNPVARDDAFTLTEDVPLTVFVTALLDNDFDVDKQAFVISRLLDSEGVSVVDNGTGQLVMTPDANRVGEAWFDYEIVDSTGRTDTARVMLDIAAVNDAPEIGAIPAFEGVEDTPFEFILPRSLATDADGDALVLELRSPHGAPLPEWIAYDALFGKVTGTPPANFNGDVELEFAVYDGVVETTKQVVLSFAPVNDAPELVTELGDVAYDGLDDVDIALPEGMFADVDGDALTLTAELADSSPLPEWLSFDGTRFTGVAPNEDSVTSVRVYASDGELIASDVFDIALTFVVLNEAPVVENPLGTVAVPEDTPVSVTVGGFVFTDPDEEDVLAIRIESADGSPLPAWLTFDGTTLTGTPPADFNGSFELVAIANDGTVETADPFTLEIVPVNDAPRMGTPMADQVFFEDQPIAFAVPEGAFTDVEADALTITATLADGSPLPEGFAFDGTTFTVDLPEHSNGRFDILLTASDGMDTSTQGFTLTIEPVNDAPTLATPLADVSVNEDTPVEIAIPAGTFADVDADSLSLRVKLADGSPLPAWLAFDGTTLSGQPPLDYNGALDLRVIATDGEYEAEDSFTLTVAPVNDAPVVAAPLADVSADEDAPVSVVIPATTFADVDGDALTVRVELADGSPLPLWLSFDGTTLSGQPPQDFNGVLDLRVVASDGEYEAIDSFALTITAVNDVPVVATPLADVSLEEDTPVSVTIPASTFADVDGDALTVRVELADGTPLPAWLSFDGTTLSGQPPQDYTGMLDLRVVASDGEHEAIDSFALTVTPVNDAPVVAMPLGDVSLEEDTPVSVTIPAGTFADVDGDALTVRVEMADGSPLPLWLSFDGTTLSGQPPQDFNGVLDLRVIASDGNYEAIDSFALTIASVNDAPVTQSDTVVGIGPSMTILAADLLANDSDADGDILTITGVRSLGAGDAWIDTSGNVVLGLLGEYIGPVELRYDVTDGSVTVSESIFVAVESQFSGWEQGGSGNDVVKTDKNGFTPIFGGNGDDMLLGAKGDDRIAGGDGDDKIRANDGDDMLWGGAGDDDIRGGHGFDVAHYYGRFADYEITLIGGQFITVEDLDPALGGDDGFDTLRDVEMLVFGDGTLVDVEALLRGDPAVTANVGAADFYGEVQPLEGVMAGYDGILASAGHGGGSAGSGSDGKPTIVTQDQPLVAVHSGEDAPSIFTQDEEWVAVVGEEIVSFGGGGSDGDVAIGIGPETGNDMVDMDKITGWRPDTFG